MFECPSLWRDIFCYCSNRHFVVMVCVASTEKAYPFSHISSKLCRTVGQNFDLFQKHVPPFLKKYLREIPKTLYIDWRTIVHAKTEKTN